jgi:hypothetical protein
MFSWLPSLFPTSVNNENNNVQNTTASATVVNFGRFTNFSSGSDNDNNKIIKQQLQFAYILSVLSEEEIQEKYITFLKKELDLKKLFSESDRIRDPTHILNKLFSIDNSIREEIIAKWKNYYEQKSIFVRKYNSLPNIE